MKDKNIFESARWKRAIEFKRISTRYIPHVVNRLPSQSVISAVFALRIHFFCWWTMSTFKYYLFYWDWDPFIEIEILLLRSWILRVGEWPWLFVSLESVSILSNSWFAFIPIINVCIKSLSFLSTKSNSSLVNFGK